MNEMAITRGAARQLENLAKGLSHPLRQEVLRVLTERQASPPELARELEADPSDVRYAVRRLRELQLIERVSTRPVEGRGAVEHFYRAIVRPMVDPDEWEGMHPMLGELMAWQAVRLMVEDFSRAAEGGRVSPTADLQASRTPLLLDRRAFRSALKKHDRLLREMLELQAESTGRMAESGEEGVHVSSSQLCVEVPSRNR